MVVVCRDAESERLYGVVLREVVAVIAAPVYCHCRGERRHRRAEEVGEMRIRRGRFICPQECLEATLEE